MTLQERGFVHKDYYTGNDLLTTRAQDGVVGFFVVVCARAAV